MTLIDQLRELDKLRAACDVGVAELKKRRAAFDSENATLVAVLKNDAAAVTAAEIAIRAVAEAEYRTTLNRKPAPGIEIKVFKEYLIDEEEGLRWAQEKKLCLIPEKLDITAIKKLATVTPLPFVVIEDVPKAQIATNLEKVLPPLVEAVAS